MKEIKLIMSERVYKELRSSMGVRLMSGNAYGVIDAAISKLVEAIKEGEEELVLQFKDEQKD